MRAWVVAPSSVWWGFGLTALLSSSCSPLGPLMGRSEGVSSPRVHALLPVSSPDAYNCVPSRGWYKVLLAGSPWLRGLGVAKGEKKRQRPPVVTQRHLWDPWEET